MRPCLHKNDLTKIINYIDNNSSSYGGILGVPVNNTIKYVTEEKKINYTINRHNLWQALTPQFFPLKLLHTCLTIALQKRITITDESSALEYCGYHPTIIDGRPDNYKLTLPEDLPLIKLYISNISK